MATPITEPAGAASTVRMMKSVDSDLVGDLDHLVGALRVHDDDSLGVRGGGKASTWATLNR